MSALRPDIRLIKESPLSVDQDGYWTRISLPQNIRLLNPEDVRDLHYYLSRIIAYQEALGIANGKH